MFLNQMMMNQKPDVNTILSPIDKLIPGNVFSVNVNVCSKCVWYCQNDVSLTLLVFRCP